MIIHTVQGGETIWGISLSYQVNINQVIFANQLDNPDLLVEGQALIIPESLWEYIVEPGDQLWLIAQRYGISPQMLIDENQIAESGLIYIGRMLIIPFTLHTVLPGETLWSIAQSYRSTVELIVMENELVNPDVIYSGQSLRIPKPTRPIKEVNAYAIRVDQLGRYEVSLVGNQLTYLSPFTYSIREDGTLTKFYEVALLSTSRAARVAPLMVLTNFANNEFNTVLASTILRSEELQNILISNVLEVLREKGYVGVNVDIEYVNPDDRENYNHFLRRLVSRLHPHGFSVSTAVAPKGSSDQTGLLYEAHDYSAHGEIVDFVILMTYEWGWAGGPPRAIAPLHQVRRVLDYAVTVIPPQKIRMGIPLYGRDWRIPWVQGSLAETVSPVEAEQLALRYGAPIRYDDTAQSPYVHYMDTQGQEHEVWYEDARSIQAKFDLINEYQLGGFSYWVLGNPFPQNWVVQHSNFKAQKLI